MAKYGSFTDFQLKSVKIYPSDGGGAIEVKSLVNSFNYVESITAPFLSATMEVVDSAGLLQGLPIQGAETVEVEVLTSFSEEAVKYVLVIWKVANRFAQNQKQAYTLGLISSEALNNEVMRVEKRLEGNPGGKEGIVSKLLKESLKTNKEFYTETSKFNVKILSNAQRPFDIIATLAIRSVSPKASNETSSSKAEESDGKTT